MKQGKDPQTNTDVTHCPGSVPRNNYLKVYGGKCLQFVVTERTWTKARTDCKSRGGDLVTIKDAGKQAFVYNTLRNLHWRYKGLWIGGSDRDREGTWVWVDGTLMKYGNWHQGQGPTTHHGFFFSTSTFEDCAEMRLDDGGKWHDYPCGGLHYSYSYICEYALSAIVVSTAVPPHSTPRPTSKTTPRHQTTLRPSPAPQTTPRPNTTPAPQTTPRPNSSVNTKPVNKQTLAPGTTARPSTAKPPVMQRSTLRPNRTPRPAMTSNARPQTKRTTYTPNIYVPPKGVKRTPISASQQGNPNPKKSTNDTDVIVGMAVGGCVAVGLLAVVFGILLRRKRLADVNGTMSVDNKVYGMATDQKETATY
ncbi:uncharacterized protein LOC132549356 [Ylistrum balloti]|uniref:uncharacterized protein LOC132549356 n=1 Tax=Ylistrum balloti TaxID=509963 RepID=UPI002905EAA8|nr:uncharacterized protein LOC132549356 [Ylistrum balloti]